MTPGTDPYEKWPAIGMPAVRGPEPLYGRILAEKAPTRQQLALTPEAEQLLLDRAKARAAGARHRALVTSPPPGLLERMLHGLRRLDADEAVLPEVPDTPAQLLAAPEPRAPLPDLLAPAVPDPIDDQGALRDELAAAYRSLAGRSGGIPDLCDTCTADGALCRVHSRMQREAARLWDFAERLSMCATSWDAALLLIGKKG